MARAEPDPHGKPRWGRRGVAREANRLKVRALVQELASKTDWTPGSPEQLVGDHYASCMDEAAIDAAGISAIAPLLADIDAAKTPADVQRVIRRLHDLGIAAPFGETGAFDNHEPKDFLLNLVAGGLGLPDRDAYVKTEPRFAEMRDKYRQHVARVLALGGMPEKATLAAADGVIALEKRLAEASLDAKTAADPAATEHKATFAQLKAMAPHVEWDKYFDEARFRDATPDGQRRPARHAEIPRDRPPVQLARVRTGVLLQARRADGATARTALRRVVARARRGRPGAPKQLEERRLGLLYRDRQ